MKSRPRCSELSYWSKTRRRRRQQNRIARRGLGRPRAPHGGRPCRRRPRAARRPDAARKPRLRGRSRRPSPPSPAAGGPARRGPPPSPARRRFQRMRLKAPSALTAASTLVGLAVVDEGDAVDLGHPLRAVRQALERVKRRLDLLRGKAQRAGCTIGAGRVLVVCAPGRPATPRRSIEAHLAALAHSPRATPFARHKVPGPGPRDLRRGDPDQPCVAPGPSGQLVGEVAAPRPRPRRSPPGRARPW